MGLSAANLEKAENFRRRLMGTGQHSDIAAWLWELQEPVADDAVEREMLKLIDQRDAAEEALSQAYYIVIGRSPEWSNNFGHGEAIAEIKDACIALRKAALKDEYTEADDAETVELIEWLINRRDKCAKEAAALAQTWSEVSERYAKRLATVQRLSAALPIARTDDRDLTQCEHCSKEFDIEQMTIMEDCWFCENCVAEFRKSFDACAHDWSPHTSAHGEPGRICRKCSGFVTDEDADVITPARTTN